MLHKDIPISGSASGGVYLQNTDSLCSCLLKLVLITATTESNTYDVKIIDSGNRVVYRKEGVTGTLRDNTDTPLRDINTIRLENVVTDEPFSGKLMVMEVA